MNKMMPPDKQNIGIRAFGTAIGMVTAINLLLALAAFLKDILLASYLGTSTQGDALMLAFFIPDTVGNNLLACAIGVSCVPILSEILIAGDREKLQHFIGKLTLWAILLSTLLWGAFTLFRGPIISNLGGGFTQGGIELTKRLFTIIAPTIVIFPLVSIGASVLQVHGRFSWPAFAPVAYNAAILAAVGICLMINKPLEPGVTYLAIAFGAGVLIMICIMFVALRASKLSFYLRLAIAQKPKNLFQFEEARKQLGIFLPYLMIMIATYGIQYAERYLASRLDVGSVSALSYAYRLSQFPVWVFVAAAVTVTYPSMAKAGSANQTARLTETAEFSLTHIILLTLPITLGLHLLREPILAVLFGRGAFDARSVGLTASVLEGYSLSILGQSILVVCLRIFLSLKELAAPTVAYMATSVLTILSDFLLVPHLRERGLGYGAMIGTYVNLIILIYLLRKRLHFRLSALLKKQLPSFLAAVPCAVFLVFYRKLWIYIPLSQTLTAGVAYLFIAVAISAAVYFGCVGITKRLIER